MIEIIDKKSKFLGYTYNVTTESQVKDILADLKKEHKKATHICYAYNICADQVLAKACDDGEPGGTAGRPIFNVIDKKNLSKISKCPILIFCKKTDFFSSKTKYV